MAGEHLVTYEWCLSGLPLDMNNTCVRAVHLPEEFTAVAKMHGPFQDVSSPEPGKHRNLQPPSLFGIRNSGRRSEVSASQTAQTAAFYKAVRWVGPCFQFISKGFCIFRSALRLAGGLAGCLVVIFPPILNTDLSRGIFILRLFFADASEEETGQLECGGEREGGGLQYNWNTVVWVSCA